MGQLVTSLIARLKADDPHLRRDLWMISDLLRKAWSQGFHSGFDEVDSEEISSEEAVELREALLDAFHRASDKAESRPFLDTLAAAHERSVKDELVKELHLTLEMHRVASARLWAALRGLDDVGEKVFERSESSRGIDCVEMNIRAAERYLRKQGILVPL
jgi:hypothetical protein